MRKQKPLTRTSAASRATIAPPAPARDGAPAPDIATQRDSTVRLGHSFGAIGVASAPPGIQPKIATELPSSNYPQGANRAARPNTRMNEPAIQRMAAVAGGLQNFNKADFTQLSHLNWAMAVSGGPLVALDSSIRDIAVGDILHIVQHGDKGIVMAEDASKRINSSQRWKTIPASGVANILIDYLPSGYKGKIRISTCYSGTPTDATGKDESTSLVGQVQANLQSQTKREDIKKLKIYGWLGPTITHVELSHSGVKTVDPKLVPTAGKLQKQLLDGKYAELKKNWEDTVTKDSGPLDKLAEKAAATWAEFYKEFVKQCEENSLLLDSVAALVRV